MQIIGLSDNLCCTNIDIRRRPIKFAALTMTISLQCAACDTAVTLSSLSEEGTECPSCKSRVGRTVDLDAVDVSGSLRKLVTGPMASSMNILPISLDGDTLTLVTVFPLPPQFLEQLRFIFNRRIELVFAESGNLTSAIGRILPDEREPNVEV
jgi:hypothetical protein